MGQIACLTDQFLIAVPSLVDPNFFHSVTYICEHNENGAMGLVINHPLEIELGEILKHLGMNPDDPGAADQRVYLGGPVQQERGFVLHRPGGDWQSMLSITSDIAITTSRDILEAIARNEGPVNTLITLGYAGWAPGQLERELTENAWLSGPADHSIIFEMGYEERWRAAAELAGIDLDRLSDEVGHA